MAPAQSSTVNRKTVDVVARSVIGNPAGDIRHPSDQRQTQPLALFAHQFGPWLDDRERRALSLGSVPRGGGKAAKAAHSPTTASGEGQVRASAAAAGIRRRQS